MKEEVSVALFVFVCVSVGDGEASGHARSEPSVSRTRADVEPAFSTFFVDLDSKTFPAFKIKLETKRRRPGQQHHQLLDL